MWLFFRCDWCFSTAVNFISTSFFFVRAENLFFFQETDGFWQIEHILQNPFFFLTFFLFLFFPLTFPLAGVCFETKRQCVETAALNKTRLGDGVWDMTGDTQLLEVGKLLKYLKPARYVLHKNEY